MKKIIWQAKISDVGKEASLFLEEKRIIIFSNRAPKYIKDYCIVHCDGKLIHSLETTQYIELFDEVYTISAVGSLASNNLKELGHVTLLFDGASEPRLPGNIHLKGSVPTKLSTHGNITIFEEI